MMVWKIAPALACGNTIVIKVYALSYVEFLYLHFFTELRFHHQSLLKYQRRIWDVLMPSLGEICA